MRKRHALSTTVGTPIAPGAPAGERRHAAIANSQGNPLIRSDIHLFAIGT